MAVKNRTAEKFMSRIFNQVYNKLNSLSLEHFWSDIPFLKLCKIMIHCTRVLKILFTKTLGQWG